MDNLVWVLPTLSSIFFGLAFYGQSVKLKKKKKDIEKLKQYK